MLARSAVDDKKDTVQSLTDHFTVMINAIVVAPEHPQVRTFNPNEIRDIQAADPGTRVTLIEPPEASSRGDANLAYPLELPPGRRGLEPRLALSYDSGRGNGWVGMGWDLPMRAVTIDTRWGVPRDDTLHETETYLFEGQELTPFAHRGPVKQRTEDTTVIDGETVKVFHPRVEGAFHRIIRHGSTPKTYWWEAVDKTGMRYFYGGDDKSGAPVTDSTLESSSGVFEWALREIRDTHDNSVHFRCKRVSHKVFPGQTVTLQGTELYLEAIDYTRLPASTTEGPYSVKFLRDSNLGIPERPDAMIDARGGFPRVTADRLRRVEVYLSASLVRAWELDYRVGAFHKSLLESIREFGADNQPFDGNIHRFEYFDEIREDAENEQSPMHGYSPTEDWSASPPNMPDNVKTEAAIPAAFLNFFSNGEASVLGGSATEGSGVHSYIGFNPFDPLKAGSFGFKVGSNDSTSTGKLSLIDIDGDGLPDKVFASGSGHLYRRNESGPVGFPRFSDTLVGIPGLSVLSEDKSHTTSYGAEAYPIPFQGGGFQALYNVANTFTTSSAYLSDVNGDGFPDSGPGRTRVLQPPFRPGDT